MIRASSAQDAELCGYIRVLQQRHPRTYRKTLLGSAFHAKAANQPDAAEKLARLTPDERAEVESWRVPDDVVDEDRLGHVTLTYAHAVHEEPVGLDDRGSYRRVTPDPNSPAGYVDEPGLLVPATVDMFWLYHHPRGRTVFVGDIKTGEHEIAGGPRNLQFVAPALALCDKTGAEWYRTGIWYAREARWELGEPVHVESDLAAQDFARLKRAATNPPVPVIGGHCTECFQRSHCDAFCLPVSQAETALAPFTKGGGLEKATPAELLQAHLVLSAMRKLEKTAHDSLKAEVERRGGVMLDDGSVLYLREQAGREYADLEVVKAAGLTQAVKRSRPSQVLAVRKP